MVLHKNIPDIQHFNHPALKLEETMKRFLCVIITVLISANSLFAAGRQFTADDYRKGYNFRNEVQNLVYNDRIQFNWLKDSPAFWYTSETKDEKEFILFNLDTNTKTKLFDTNKLAQALESCIDKKFDAKKLPIFVFSFLEDKNTILFKYENNNWIYKLDNDELKKEENAPEMPNRRGWRSRYYGNRLDSRNESPDGKWKVYADEHNVWLENIETSEQNQLTTDGTEESFYDNQFFWAPDSANAIGFIKTPAEMRKVHYIESSPEDQLQPKHFTIDYNKPGDKLTIEKPVLINVTDKSCKHIDDSLFPNPYFISDYHWSKDGNYFYFFYNQRGHQVGRVIAIDTNTGQAKAVINEETDSFFDYNHKKYLKYLDDTNEIIWASERDGWNHLYLYDAVSGKVKNQITKGDWLWRSVEKLDIENRNMMITISGYYHDQDPYFIHYAKINFDGSGLTLLTTGNGTHRLTFSPDDKFYIDTYSRIDSPPVYELRNSNDGSLICEIERADAGELIAAGWPVTEPFVTKDRNDKYDIWGIIHRPRNFDPNKKYPVIEDIYAGPHGNHVPKSWRGYDYWHQALCELGFIVVQIDGLGTSNRCKEFHHFAWKNLADAGFPDRIKWMKAAAEKYPYMDIERVGIYGTSAGGQSALGALLFHPEFYDVAVASCGCHDNRMDKIWWNELWMGYPIDDHYKEQSNVTNAHKLEGRLLLIVGELDRNVDPASTMQVVNALIKANKDFDMLYLPGMDHSAGGKFGERKRRDFFIKYLLDDIPVDWNTVPDDIKLP